MGVLVHYSLEVALLLVAVYLIYRWALASATFHRFNRAVLLSGYALALTAFPAIGIAAGMSTGASELSEVTMAELQQTLANLHEEASPSWPEAVAYLYLAGMLVAAILTMRSIARIRRIIRQGHHSRAGRYILVTSAAKGVAPFSWGRYIVVPASTSEADLPAIIAHETIHLNRRHWADLALGQAVIVLNWFNPAAYLMMKELQDVHEFEVDAEMADAGMDMRMYQMLLLRNATGSAIPRVANRLSCSQLKARFLMMGIERSNPLRRLAALALIPAATLTIIAAQTDVVASPLDAMESAYTVFDTAPREVTYSIEGNDYIIAYGSGEEYTSVSMTAENGQPDVYIDGYKASFAKLSRLKAKDIDILLGDSQHNRFIVTLKRKR